QHRAELGELSVVASCNDDEAVGRWKNLIGHDVGVRVADALGYLAGNQKVERLVGEHPDLAVDQGGVYVAAATGALALGERGENAPPGVDPGEVGGARHTSTLGFAVGRPGRVQDPADALGHKIVAGARGVRAGLAEAGDRAIYQARI